MAWGVWGCSSADMECPVFEISSVECAQQSRQLLASPEEWTNAGIVTFCSQVLEYWVLGLNQQARNSKYSEYPNGIKTKTICPLPSLSCGIWYYGIAIEAIDLGGGEYGLSLSFVYSSLTSLWTLHYSECDPEITLLIPINSLLGEAWKQPTRELLNIQQYGDVTRQRKHATVEELLEAAADMREQKERLFRAGWEMLCLGRGNTSRSQRKQKLRRWKPLSERWRRTWLRSYRDSVYNIYM
jgi:hypothetical protein